MSVTVGASGATEAGAGVDTRRPIYMQRRLTEPSATTARPGSRGANRARNALTLLGGPETLEDSGVRPGPRLRAFLVAPKHERRRLGRRLVPTVVTSGGVQGEGLPSPCAVSRRPACCGRA